MSYPAQTTSFGSTPPKDPLSPYARAAKAWDQRIGSARVQAANWRYIAFGALALALISTAGAVTLAVKKQVATYIVEVDSFGMPARITQATTVYHPQPAQIGFFVAQVVRLSRQRTMDPVMTRRDWIQVYHFISGHAISAMNEYAAADSGLTGGNLIRSVEITNVLQKSPDSYQVRWMERTYVSGKLRGNEPWTGLFQVKLLTPRDEAEVFQNPLGVRIVRFTWSREFSGPVTSEKNPA